MGHWSVYFCSGLTTTFTWINEISLTLFILTVNFFEVEGDVGIIMSFFSFSIEVLTLLASLLTASIATAAFIYTKKEYRLHIEREQSQTLSKFNERYCADKNIEAVVKYLIGKRDGATVAMPTTYQLELFLRFYEELEYALSKKMLDENLIFEMFSYYALAAYYSEEFMLKYLDENCWNRFLAFVGRMRRIELEKLK